MNTNDPIRECQDRLQKLQERAERLRPVLKSCEEAIQRSDVKASISVGNRRPTEPKVEITMFCKNLKETVPLFRELAKEGLRTDKENTHEDRNVMKVIPMRIYSLGPDCEVVAKVVTSGEPGDACRMEQVGVKEVPIYEMKCGE